LENPFHLDHEGLLASYEALRQILVSLEGKLEPLGDTDYYQHHVFADRASDLVNYLEASVELAGSMLYEAAFVICRAALEHHLIDYLLFLASKYRLVLRDFPQGEYERLRAEQRAGNPGTEDIVGLTYDPEQKVLSIVRTGVHEREGQRGPGARALSRYYFIIDEFSPFRVPKAALPHVRSRYELPDDVVERHLLAHVEAWRRHLRWEAIKDNLKLNGLCTEKEIAHLDVHYAFLSAFVHPVSLRAPEAIRGHNARGFHRSYDHYASELALLYVVVLAERELEAFKAMTSRAPAVGLRGWDDTMKPSLLVARQRSAHLWFQGDTACFFDREEEAVARNQEDGIPRPVTLEQVNAIPPEEVGYYENPLRRLRELHQEGRGYPWNLYRSPWPRTDASRVL
jgi:hypothetical protein